MARKKSNNVIVIERRFIERKILNPLGIELIQAGDDTFSQYTADLLYIGGLDYLIKGLNKYIPSLREIEPVQEKSTYKPGIYYNNEVCQNLKIEREKLSVVYKGYEKEIYKYHHLEKVFKECPDVLRGGIFQAAIATIRFSGTVLRTNKSADIRQGILWFGDEWELKKRALQELKDNFDEIVNYLLFGEIEPGVKEIGNTFIMVDKQGEKATLNIMIPRHSNYTLMCILCKYRCDTYRKETPSTTHISKRTINKIEKIGFPVLQRPVGMQVFKPVGYEVLCEEDYILLPSKGETNQQELDWQEAKKEMKEIR